jgi:hypothetical protein
MYKIRIQVIEGAEVLFSVSLLPDWNSNPEEPKECRSIGSETLGYRTDLP